MTEQPNSDNSGAPQQTESEVLFLIRKLNQQLVSLEKKVDLLISRSKERPFREKQFSKPFRSFSRPNRPGQYPDKRGRDEDSTERRERFKPTYSSGQHFEKRERSERDERFGGPKKDYSEDRGSNSGQDRHFKKGHDHKKRGFDPRNKPFFHKRKNK